MKTLILCLAGSLLLCGCAHLEPPEPVNPGPLPSDKLAIRNNAASLLYDLLGDEQDVSKILVVKHHDDELAALIKTISLTARNNRKLLEELAAGDPTLNLQTMNLPPGEAAARQSEGKSKEHDLLFTSNQEFAFNLRLTQTEALNYGWHLARVAAENSSDPAEVRHFTTIWHLMENLYRETFRQMRGG